MPERRQTCRMQGRILAVDLRSKRPKHLDIVAGSVAAGQHQRLAADFVECVFQFGGAVSRIDVDQNGADARGAELDVKPFGAIGRPDADTVALPNTEREQAGGDLVRSFAQIVPAYLAAGFREDRGGTPAMP